MNSNKFMLDLQRVFVKASNMFRHVFDPCKKCGARFHDPEIGCPETWHERKCNCKCHESPTNYLP